MKITNLICLVFFLALGAAIQARPPALLVRGRIVDDHGDGVSYCTISLRRASDSTIVAGVVADSLGHYSLSTDTEGGLLLECAHLAYETVLVPLEQHEAETVCDVTLVPRTNPIKEVAVLSRFIERKAGRLIVSMAGNPLARDRFLNEAIVLLPGLRQEQDRTFKVNGRAIKAIYIDNRPATPDELKALPAESVRSVEIRQNATSDQGFAERGAVMRITLRPLADGGWRGTLQGSAGMRDNGFGDAGISMPLSMRYGKTSLYNYISYSYFDELHEYAKRIDLDDTESSIVSSEDERTRHHTLSERLNLVCEIAPRHRVGLTGGFNYVASAPDIRSVSASFADPASTSVSHSRYRACGDLTARAWQVAASYRYLLDDEGSELTADLDYLHYATDKFYRYAEQTDAEAAETSTERMTPRTGLLRGQIDLKESFSDRMTLYVGAEYYRRNLRRRTLLVDPDVGPAANRFRYRGDGAAVYAESEWSAGRFELVGGLRLQWDRVDHFTLGDDGWRRKEYWRLCPDLTACYAIDEERGTSIEIGYSRDYGRIPYTQLSPLKVRESEFRYSIGNPMLAPSRGYDLTVTLTMRERWSLYYTYTHGADLVQLRTFVDTVDPRQSYTMPENCASTSNHSLGISYAGPLTRWWRINWEVYGACWRKEYYGQTLRSRIAEVFLNNSIEFTDGFGMQLYFHAASARRKLEWSHNATYALHATLYKSLCKKRLRLSMECNGLVSNDNEVCTWNIDGSYRDFLRHRSRRYFTLSLGYSFDNYRGRRAIARTRTLQQIRNEYK